MHRPFPAPCRILPCFPFCHWWAHCELSLCLSTSHKCTGGRPPHTPPSWDLLQLLMIHLTGLFHFLYLIFWSCLSSVSFHLIAPSFLSYLHLEVALRSHLSRREVLCFQTLRGPPPLGGVPFVNWKKAFLLGRRSPTPGYRLSEQRAEWLQDQFQCALLCHEQPAHPEGTVEFGKEKKRKSP